MTRSLAAITAALLTALAAGDEVVLQGHVGLHDPSTMLQADGVWHVFATGWGVRHLESNDLVTWKTGPPVFQRGQTPGWTAEQVPGSQGRYWAPDLVHAGNEYRLYYSVSTFGKQTSAIGLAVAPALSSAPADRLWQDRGVVVSSDEGDPYNAIDPSVLLDDDGRHWMAFGSYWDGVYLVELNPADGSKLEGAQPIRLAWAEMIEAPTLIKRDGHYYLFVNHGLCCRGIKSTYRILVGRSDRVEGPYVDHQGVALIDGGGTPVLGSEGPRIGPGHVAPIASEQEARFGFHYYDGQDHGRSKLALARWEWTPDGWPQATEVQLSGEDASPRFRRPRRPSKNSSPTGVSASNLK